MILWIHLIFSLWERGSARNPDPCSWMWLQLHKVSLSSLGSVCLGPGGFTQRNKLRHLFCSSSLIKLFTKCPGHRLPLAQEGGPGAGRCRAGFVAPVVPGGERTHTKPVFSPLCKCTHIYVWLYIYVSVSCENSIDPWRETPLRGQYTHLASA